MNDNFDTRGFKSTISTLKMIFWWSWCSLKSGDSLLHNVISNEKKNKNNKMKSETIQKIFEKYKTEVFGPPSGPENLEDLKNLFFSIMKPSQELYSLFIRAVDQREGCLPLFFLMKIGAKKDAPKHDKKGPILGLLNSEPKVSKALLEKRLATGLLKSVACGNI